MATEWFISGNPKKYDCVNAFRDLRKIDWRQSTNVEAGDIVYIYVSGEEHAVRFKCKANKVDIKVPDIDDKKYDLTGEFDGTAGRYMELELIEELNGDLYDHILMEKHGFGTPQSPVRVNLETREYLKVAQELQHIDEMDPDKHDGSYELARETVRAYKNMCNLDQIDFRDMNLIYHMVIGTWRQKIDIKKKSISESHLPDNEKSRLVGLLDTIWNRSKNNAYTNREGDVSIGMFGTAFYSFYDAKKEDCIRFIQMCIDILDNDSDEEMFDICQKALSTGISGMQAASASVILHCLKPYTFPVFNSNSGNPNIYLYFGIDLEKVSDLSKYIENCKKVKTFRDNNFTVKNYRIFDLEARKLGNGDKEYDALQEMNLTEIDLIYDKGGNDEMSETEFDKNIILYGPPGTGKTYNTAIYAVAICDKLSLDEVKSRPYEEVLDRYRVLKDEEKRVAFTTFHHSYGYEEFIEGIKPKMDSEALDVEYTIKDGVFKDFCDRASKKKTSSSGVNVGENARVWNVILGGNNEPELKQRCFNEGTIRIGWHKSPEVITDETEGLNDKERRILLNFQDEMEIGDVVVARATSDAVDGVAIITGEVEFDTSDKHYPRKRRVQWLYKGANISIIDLNGGTRLDRKSVYPLNRISVGDLLSRVPTEAGVEVKDETRPFVFIIDEINRGNISKIFGELITLIEPTKRKGAKEAMEATLPYSNVPFGVPNNVYLIGTMNTADRSIAIMDTALRRRFQFEEMMPNPQVLRNIGADKVVEGDVELDVAEMLEVINKRIEYLFDREHTIGHAFFTDLKDEPTVQKLASIFKKSVIPLLQEYFYEDYSKIRMCLGDNGKENTEHMFILANEIKSNQIFRGDTSDVDIPDYAYVIQDEAFDNIMSYKEIIG